ncbi:MAG: class I SAM-dependent methyltransferase [Chthoniobacterales bacterium]|nr:class I SAM-dependent methyltransferase [Chthoniobacterales bacterium]
MICRNCGAALELTMVDLGTCPPSNSYLSSEALDAPEKWYPLRVMVCTGCWLAQTVDFVDREDCFSSTYAYFSSCSASWVEHARSYAEAMIKRLGLGSTSQVVELAANDGYLLQHFSARGIPCYGIEPTESTADVARGKGLEIVGLFFGLEVAGRLAQERGRVDLLAANNVFAHVPDIRDFAGGIFELLAPRGVATIEFPHLLQLIEKNYFDTIYHEHFSYLSLHAVAKILGSVGLEIFDVEELSTHGGSLRVFARRKDGVPRTRTVSVADFLKKEKAAGILNPDFYRSFSPCVERVKDDFLEFLLHLKREGKSIAAYGAAAKGNTLLNYSGVRRDLLPFVVDRSPGKIGTYLPGSRIPVFEEEALRKAKPDYVLILPWNLREEIQAQLSYVREWGAQFVVAVPHLETFAP